MSFKEPEGQVARWLQALSEYEYVIIHRAGKDHGNADGLSRQSCKQCGQIEVDVNATVGRSVGGPKDKKRMKESSRINVITMSPEWEVSIIAEKQRNDPDIGPIYRALELQKQPTADDIVSWPRVAKKYAVDWPRLVLEEGVAKRIWYGDNGEEESRQILVPRIMVSEILTAAHDEPLAGHFAERRTKERVRPHYFWYGLTSDIRRWCASCDVCGGRKSKPTRAHHPMQREVVSEPLQRVAIDILGPIDPPTSRGNRYVLVVVDYLTKWSEAFAMPDQTTKEINKHLVGDFICRMGIPVQLHSDQGRQFESQVFQEMCQLLGIRKTRTTPLHPQSDGQTERMNRTLLDVLAKLTRDNRTNWDEHLCYAMAAYRSSVHATTGETPNRLMLGREVNTPISLLAPPAPDTVQRTDWVESLHEKFRDTHERVVEVTGRQQQAGKFQADLKQKGYNFDEGSLVWLYDPKPKKGISPKLDAKRWAGPFRVIKRISQCVYCVRRDGDRKGRVVNVDRLAPYLLRDGDRFPTAANITAEDEFLDDDDMQIPETEPEVENLDDDATEFLRLIDRHEETNRRRQREPVHEVYDEIAAVEQELRTMPWQNITTRTKRQTTRPTRLRDYDVDVE